MYIVQIMVLVVVLLTIRWVLGPCRGCRPNGPHRKDLCLWMWGFYCQFGPARLTTSHGYAPVSLSSVLGGMG